MTARAIIAGMWGTTTLRLLRLEAGAGGASRSFLACRVRMFRRVRVMRGQETEIAGWRAHENPAPDEDRLLCLPGAPAKWVRMRGSIIDTFVTSISGEAFAAMRAAGVLVPAPPGLPDTPGAAFREGVEDALRAGASLLHQVFSARTPRTAIREAVKMLTAKGLVGSRPRRGAYVEPENNWNLLDPDVLRWTLQRRFSLELLREFLIVRKGIEPTAAREAALHADAAAIARGNARKAEQAVETLLYEAIALIDGLVEERAAKRKLKRG